LRTDPLTVIKTPKLETLVNRLFHSSDENIKSKEMLQSPTFEFPKT